MFYCNEFYRKQSFLVVTNKFFLLQVNIKYQLLDYVHDKASSVLARAYLLILIRVAAARNYCGGGGVGAVVTVSIEKKEQ